MGREPLVSRVMYIGNDVMCLLDELMSHGVLMVVVFVGLLPAENAPVAGGQGGQEEVRKSGVNWAQGLFY